MAKQARNLSLKFVRKLRQVQTFLMQEPKRFNMVEGIAPADVVKEQLELPPCGTACCYAGAIYVIDTELPLNKSQIGFGVIWNHVLRNYHLDADTANRLFYVKSGIEHWLFFYIKMYNEAKIALERACVGVARIEHFIATDGRE